jgi:hypothetical protein
LVATDSAGRTGSETRPVTVRATTPYFLALKAPGRVPRRARGLTLTVAATQVGTLRVRGRQFKVGRSPRRIRVRVGAGRRTVRLRLTLVAGGGRSQRLVVIPRR